MSRLFVMLLAVTCATSPAWGQTTRNPASWPFSSDSPWNVSLGSGANYGTISSSKYSSSGGAYLNVTQWSYPVFVAANTDRLVNFYDSDGNQLIASGRCPSNAAPDPSDDGSMIVINGAEAVEMWRAFRVVSGGDWYASAMTLTDLTGTGFYSSYHGTRAGGMSSVGGLIRRDELVNLNIPHALAIAMQPTALNRNTPSGKAWVWPASWADGVSSPGSSYSTNGNLYMGSLLAIPPSVNINSLGLGTQGLAVAKALQDYGAYITDTGGGNVIYFAEAAANSAIQSSLRNDLAKLTPHLRVVTNNTAASVGGGGTRRRPAAPPLSLSAPTTPTTPTNPTPTQGAAIQGTIRNSRGTAISAARVVLYSSSGQFLATISSDSNGNYRFGNLSTGTFNVNVSAYRYDTLQRSTTISSSTQTQTLDFSLSRSY